MTSSKLDSYRYTDVAAHKSKEAIEKLLLRVGAVGFRWSSAIAQGQEADGAGVGGTTTGLPVHGELQG